MSNIAATFASAPRMKIYISGIPVAYAVGINVNISTEVSDVYTLGSFSALSLETTMLNIVSGTMQIVRVLDQNTQVALNAIANSQSQLTTQSAIRPTTDFNAFGTDGQVVAQSGTSNSVLNSTLARHLSAEKVLLSKTFDIKCFFKVPNIDAAGNPIVTAANPTGLIEQEWFNLVNARITSDAVNISQGQLVNIPVTFQALLATPKNSRNADFQLDGSVRQSLVPGQ